MAFVARQHSRELQNLVERAVILSRDGILPNPLHKRQTSATILSSNGQSSPLSMTWQDSDRALIVETLEQAGWIVGGPRGAAVKLGLKRTTLLAKMRRLGYLSTYHSGRRRYSRANTGRCSDLNRTRARGHERAPTPSRPENCF